MLDAFHRTFVAVVYLVLFLTAVMAVWLVADDDFRHKLLQSADPYISKWISDRPEITDLRAEVESDRSKISRLQMEKAELEQQLAGATQELEQVSAEVDQERDKLNTEFARIKDELDKEVSSREIAIEQVRNRFTVIRVGDKILFDTGSSQLKQRGREVLGLIANTLGKFSDRQVRVEGHTDDQPIVSSKTRKRYPSNWELSSARATSAVRYLIEKGGLDPLTVIAVGLGEFHPIASNDTSQGRARNRRIEIVLMPAEESYRTQEIEGL